MILTFHFKPKIIYRNVRYWFFTEVEREGEWGKGGFTGLSLYTFPFKASLLL